MLTRLLAIAVGLALPTVVYAEVAVELVPDQPGPYLGGEQLTVDVWLHSEVQYDVLLAYVRFDFSDTDVRLSLDPLFTFDYTSIPGEIGAYGGDPALPLPWTLNPLDYVCPDYFLPLPSGGSLHIGSIGLRLPQYVGVYRLDTLNADEPNELLGGVIGPQDYDWWRAFTGEVTGGQYDFAVTPPIPTASGWGLMTMTLLLAILGSRAVVHRPSMRAVGAIAILIALNWFHVNQRASAEPAPMHGDILAVSQDSGVRSADGLGLDPARPMLPQFDLLTDEQMREVMRSMDPLATDGNQSAEANQKNAGDESPH